MSDRENVAKWLAGKHYEIEPGITHIFKILDKPEIEMLPTAPIKLLEVNTDTPAAGIMPLHFGGVPGSPIPYPSVIVEITPEEFEQVKARELQLPEGWTVGEEYPKGNSNG